MTLKPSIVDPELTGSIGRDKHGHPLSPRLDEQWYADLDDINPWTPTSARAGSLQKVRVLAKRMMEGAPLWHPLDSIDLRAEHRNLMSLPWHRGGTDVDVDDDEDDYDDEF